MLITRQIATRPSSGNMVSNYLIKLTLLPRNRKEDLPFFFYTDKKKKKNMAAEEGVGTGFNNEQEEIMNEKAASVEEFEEGEIVGGDDSEASSSSAIPHPLEHSWTFWFDNLYTKSKQAAWGDSIRAIHTFSTAEDFWSIYNNIHHPSKLAGGADLYCFKQRIEPKWEDPICANGGKWTISYTRGKADTSWLYTLLAMIGEQFDHGDEICGAVVNVRGKQERISLWTKNALNEAAQMSLGKQWKEFLDYNDSIGFVFHEDAKKLERLAKNKYTL